MRIISRLSAAVAALAVIAIMLRLISFYSHYEPRILELQTRVQTNLTQAGGRYVTLDDISDEFLDAVVSTEDRRFWKHRGVDIRGLARAVITNLKEERYAQGGSTITQQLARGQFLTLRKSLPRKVKEILLAVDIERKYTKNEILEMYVNQSYYGHGAHGIYQAARVYLGKPPGDLDLAESTLLAGLLRGPSLYDPYLNPDLAKTRQGEVLKNMVEVGYIPETLADATYMKKLPLVGEGKQLYQ